MEDNTNTREVHPDYYNRYSVEVIEMARRVFYPNDPEGFAKACEFTAFIYRQRMGLKPGNDIRQDMGKEDAWLRFAHDVKD